MTSPAKRLYDHAPITFQNIAISMAGHRRNRSRYGAEYWRERERLVIFDRLSLEDKIRRQEQLLSRFVRHAKLNSEFHADRLAHLHTEKITIDELANLPIMTKEDVRRQADKVYTAPRRRSVEGHTGGTTGKSLIVRFTEADSMHRMASIDHFKAKHGFEHRSMKRATFNGQHIVAPGRSSGDLWRFNRPTNQMIMSSFHLSEDNIPRYIKMLNAYKPASIDGFFSSILDVASYLNRKQIALEFTPIAIFPTSETVTPQGRATIEQAFGAPVRNQYSSSEGAPFVTECTAGTMHMDMSTGVIEHQPDDSILITSFHTFGTPLLRYAIGDVMSPSALTQCTCGVASHTVGNIGGRTDEFLVRADGARVTAGNVANIFKNLPNALVGAQLRQHRVGEVEIRVQWDVQLYDRKFEDTIRQEFYQKFDSETSLIITTVDDLERADSGKQRFIINSIDE